MVIESLIYPLASLLCVAALTEAIVEMIKSLVPKDFTDNAKRIMAVVVAVVLSLTLNVTIFDLSGGAHYVGVVLAGMIASRGSNYIHSLANIFEAFAKKK